MELVGESDRESAVCFVHAKSCELDHWIPCIGSRHETSHPSWVCNLSNAMVSMPGSTDGA